MVAAEKWGHNIEVQEVNIVEVLVPMRNLCDSPNYGCKHYHMVNSSIGFYSPSWTCMPKVSLHRVLIVLFSLFHLVTIQTH